MQELRPGLWRWTAPHPDWKPGAEWDEHVGCLAYAPEGSLVLIDPLEQLSEGFSKWLGGLAEGRQASILVSVHWHERDARELAERYEADLWAPGAPPDGLPAGVQALHVDAADEALFLLPDGTLAAGDTLIAHDGRLALSPPSWYDEPRNWEQARDELRRALDLPVEAVVVSHGEPALFDRPALEAALRA